MRRNAFPLFFPVLLSLFTGCGGTTLSDGRSASEAAPAIRTVASIELADIGLRSSGGRFLVAEGGGDGAVNANRATQGPWETFVVEADGPLEDGREIHLRTQTGRYLVAEGGGGGELNADRKTPGTWETFKLHRIAGAGRILPGDEVALQTSNGHFVVAEGGGGSGARADRDRIGPWETWTLTGALRRPSFPPRDALRTFRCDIAGMHLPDITAYGATEVVFTDIYPAYPPEIRRKIREQTHAHGYTHLVFSPKGGYRGLYPNFNFIDRPDDFRAILREVWDDGLIPVVFLIPDDISPVTMDEIKRKLTPFLDKTKDLIRVAATGWEINGWMSADVMTQSAIWLRSQLEPETLLYIHFTPEHAAGCDTDGCESTWWRSMTGVLNGIFYQDDRRDEAALQDRLSDFTQRFGSGFHGWPTGFDTVAFEYSAYWEVNHGYPESFGQALGAAALRTPGPVPVRGFCDGGPRP